MIKKNYKSREVDECVVVCQSEGGKTPIIIMVSILIHPIL